MNEPRGAGDGARAAQGCKAASLRFAPKLASGEGGAVLSSETGALASAETTYGVGWVAT